MQRKTDYPVEPLFMDRWSPRAFDETSMPALDLLTIIEAARWAPSCYNIQPWRFLYSYREDIHWQKYLTLLDAFNESWACHASALVFIVSDSLMPNADDTQIKRSNYHSFDAGAAWAQLALQATALGYQAHAMAGIEFEKTKEYLGIPDQFKVEIAVAIGKRADPLKLPEALQEREYPSQRLGMQEIAFAGLFPK